MMLSMQLQMLFDLIKSFIWSYIYIKLILIKIIKDYIICHNNQRKKEDNNKYKKRRTPYSKLNQETSESVETSNPRET